MLSPPRLLGSAARALEPQFIPFLRGAVSLPDDHAVDPIAVVAALGAACAATGVEVRCATEVSDPSALDAERVVLARGAWSGTPVRPVKGQALRLRDPNGPGLCDRVLRWARPIPGYLVPRGDGRYYLGATAEERGFDAAPTAVAMHELLRDASEILPGVLEMEIEELVVGFRPGTQDNLPIIGADPTDPRVLWATGHYRGGVLLAPLTAELVVAELTGSGLAAGHHSALTRAVRAGGDMSLIVNGEPSSVAAPTTIAELLLAIDAPTRGVAVAVDGEVIRVWCLGHPHVGGRRTGRGADCRSGRLDLQAGFGHRRPSAQATRSPIRDSSLRLSTGILLRRGGEVPDRHTRARAHDIADDHVFGLRGGLLPPGNRDSVGLPVDAYPILLALDSRARGASVEPGGPVGGLGRCV